MQALYAVRAVKEELKIEKLEQQIAFDKDLHQWAKDKREEEEEEHYARMQELGVEIEHITRRRPDITPRRPDDGSGL